MVLQITAWAFWDFSSDLEILEALLRVMLRIITKEKLREQRKEIVENWPLAIKINSIIV